MLYKIIFQEQGKVHDKHTVKKIMLIRVDIAYE